jgi:putative FmdB family regulatory protein
MFFATACSQAIVLLNYSGKRLMPTYEYACEKCHQQFELIQSINDKALEICPKDKCAQKTWGKGRVKRVIGAGAGLIFKGSGFYITDYRSKEYKERAKKESGSSAPSTDSKSTASTPPASTPAPAKPTKKATE